MIEEINKRIIEVMLRTEHSKSAFAKVLDVSLPLITHITTGRNKPGLDIIQKVLTHFDKINPDWLLLGKGKMNREESKKQDFIPLANKITMLSNQIEAIKLSQISVIQYHKILLDEVMHLAEMDVLLANGNDQLEELNCKIAAIKIELLSL